MIYWSPLISIDSSPLTDGVDGADNFPVYYPGIPTNRNVLRKENPPVTLLSFSIPVLLRRKMSESFTAV